MSNEMQKVPFKEKAEYGFGDFASCLFWITIMYYFTYFYTDVFVIPAADIFSLIRSGKRDEPMKAIDKLIADFKGHPDLTELVFDIERVEYYSRAFQYKNQGQQAEAKDYFTKAMAIWERVITKLPLSAAYTPRAHYSTGVCYPDLGEYEKSVNYFRKVVDNWPNYQHTWSAQRLILNLTGFCTSIVLTRAYVVCHSQVNLHGVCTTCTGFVYKHIEKYEILFILGDSNMQFGHFDDENKEYVIDRPDTPQSWANYLGSTKYGAIITFILYICLADLSAQNYTDTSMFAVELFKESGPNFENARKLHAEMLRKHVDHTKKRKLSPLLDMLYPEHNPKRQFKPILSNLNEPVNDKEQTKEVILPLAAIFLTLYLYMLTNTTTQVEREKVKTAQLEKESTESKVDIKSLQQNLSKVKESIIEMKVEIEHLRERNTRLENLAEKQSDRKRNHRR